MPKLRVLSGKDVVKILTKFGFEIVSQKGSHVKLRRVLPDGTKQALIIPMHNELDKGTLKAIIKQASKYIPIDTLKQYFYR